MGPRHVIRTGSAWLALAAFAAVAVGATVSDDDFESVSSAVSNGYQRVTRADGSPEPETYTFLRGGELRNDTADPTLDRMSFDEIAATLARSLALRGYVPSRDRANLKLLIVVYWGATNAPLRVTPFAPDTPVSPQSSTVGSTSTPDAQPDFAERLAPYTSGADLPGNVSGGVNLSRTADLTGEVAQRSGDAARREAAQLLGYRSSNDPDLLGSRYFVVLLAYDFQKKLSSGENRLLWQTRFSIATRHHAFAQQLRAMTATASAYFGRNGGDKLPLVVPEGRVDIGETRVLGEVTLGGPADLREAALAPDGAHVAWWRTHRERLELVITALDVAHPPVVAEIPPQSAPVPLIWVDHETILVAAEHAEPFLVSVSGRWLDAKRHPAPATPTSAANGTAIPALAELRHRVETMLPERTVTLLGTNSTQRRVLLVATDGVTAGRYFVFDAGDGLLTEVGRRWR